jgi:hypothetical protein
MTFAGSWLVASRARRGSKQLERISEILEQVKAAAMALSRRLGYWADTD